MNLNIAEDKAFTPDPSYLTQSASDDYKPTYSPDGSKIAFFRVIDYGYGPDFSWKTKICVMNADGTEFKELTSGNHMDFNPMWTRNGCDRITFTRFESSVRVGETVLPIGMNVYWTDPDGEVNEEQRISSKLFYEMAYSSLADGRILVLRQFVNDYIPLLLTPNPGCIPTYEKISYPNQNTMLCFMSISPSESKITYMKIADANFYTVLGNTMYTDNVIAYADFDPVNLKIDNEVEITTKDTTNWTWYPCWTQNEDFIVYAKRKPEKGHILAYSLSEGTTTKISANDDLDYRYPNVKGVVK